MTLYDDVDYAQASADLVKANAKLRVIKLTMKAMSHRLESTKASLLSRLTFSWLFPHDVILKCDGCHIDVAPVKNPA